MVFVCYTYLMHHQTNEEEFTKECSKTNSFSELVPLAMAELKKYTDGVEVVCGPISTGGRGTPEANLKVFEATIKGLQAEGRPLFNQMPYEERIFFFRKQWQESAPENAGKYYTPILEEFYRPIFEAGLVKKAWFIPGWESSQGARWERELLTKVGAEIIDLTDEQIDGFLAGSISKS